MRRSKLIIGTTNSVAVGTPDEEIEEIYQRSFKPYLRSVYTAPTIPATLHYSGYLLDWLERHHSEYIDVLAEMVNRKQVELIGGGFYDPILALLPRQDRIGQIERLTTHLRQQFGRRPRGVWITEHVWQPSLASTLASSGMEYTFLDDYYFVTGGFSGEQLRSPCITEDQGKTLVVFPVCHNLIRESRTSEPGEVIAHLKEHATENPDVISVFMDDGTHYGNRAADRRSKKDWQERFLELVAQNREWLEVLLPSQHLRERPPRTRGYFQSAAYEEMMFWTTSPEQQEAHEDLRKRLADERDTYMFGGRFRESLTKYGESNLMYARMHHTHVLVNQVRGDRYRKQAAREELWRGQSHFAYWHGRHGGVYRNALRKHVYRSLIEAEKITRERGIFIPSVVTVDFDMDGLTEYLYQGQDLNAYIHLEGGILFELDHLKSGWNYLDTMSRRPEGYHTAKVRKDGYDHEMHRSFMDRFLDPSVTLAQFRRSNYEDLGRFTRTLYECTESKRDGKRLKFHARSQVAANRTASGARRPASRSLPVAIEKGYEFKRTAVHVEYRITNDGERDLTPVFAPEMNAAFLSQAADSLRLFAVATDGATTEVSPDTRAHAGTTSMRMQDLINGVTVTLSASDPDEIWCIPIETTSACNQRIQTTYQGTCLVPRWRLALRPGETFAASVTVAFE